MLLSTAVDTHSLEIVKLVIPTNTPTKESFLQDPITNHQLVGTVSYECVHIFIIFYVSTTTTPVLLSGNLDACIFQIQRLPPFFQHLPLFHHLSLQPLRPPGGVTLFFQTARDTFVCPLVLYYLISYSQCFKIETLHLSRPLISYSSILFLITLIFFKIETVLFRCPTFKILSLFLLEFSTV